MSPWTRALAVWLLLLVGAILNGALRQAWLVPSYGERIAHAISSVLLAGLIFGLGWATASWWRPPSLAGAWLVGGVWLGLTLAFEFLAGHFVFGAPWPKLLADYNLAQGRIWLLVLLSTAGTPPLVFLLRR